METLLNILCIFVESVKSSDLALSFCKFFLSNAGGLE